MLSSKSRAISSFNTFLKSEVVTKNAASTVRNRCLTTSFLRTQKPGFSSPSATESAGSGSGDGLSNSGKLFFGSLCVGTFGLGVWQLLRLQEKIELIDHREKQLKLQPIDYNDCFSTSSRGFVTSTTEEGTANVNTEAFFAADPYRRRLLRGVFRHEKELLIGPRGAPQGVQIPVSGLSAKSSKTSSTTTTAPGPQGYQIFTPMQLDGNDDTIVWINRGWVPKTIVPGSDRPHFKSRDGRIDIVQKAKLEEELAGPPAWSRPRGVVEVTAILSKPEKPKFITPQHDYTKRPLQLFWIDGLALKAMVADIRNSRDNRSIENEDNIPLLVQVSEDSGSDHDNVNKSATYPLQPPVSSISEFKTTPAVHAGYSATWFGLSAAGFYMTKKLISKGRF